jgi:hypothetical protein
VQKSIHHREDIERKIVTERAATIDTTTVEAEEVTAAANIPEEIHAFDGLTSLMEFSLQPVHRRDIERDIRTVSFVQLSS